MRGLTLTPPWASLITAKEKQYETRSWPTSYRGVLAIHQAKNVTAIGGESGLRLLLEREPFQTTLRQHLSGYTIEEMADDLPRGAIVGVGILVGCYRTEEIRRRLVAEDTESSRRELAFGDYTDRRWAWLIQDVLGFAEPVPCRGMQGLWDVPEDVCKLIAEVYPVELHSREERAGQ